MKQEEYNAFLKELEDIKSRWKDKEYITENEVLEIIIAYLDNIRRVNLAKEKDNESV